MDAVVADPPARQAMARDVNAWSIAAMRASGPRQKWSFAGGSSQWQQAAPVLEAWAHRSVRLSDTEARARQLGRVGGGWPGIAGLLDAHAQPAAGWQDSQMAVIADAEKPSGLVRFVFLPDLRKLVEAAAKSGPVE